MAYAVFGFRVCDWRKAPNVEPQVVSWMPGANASGDELLGGRHDLSYAGGISRAWSRHGWRRHLPRRRVLAAPSILAQFTFRNLNT